MIFTDLPTATLPINELPIAAQLIQLTPPEAAQHNILAAAILAAHPALNKLRNYEVNRMLAAFNVEPFVPVVPVMCTWLLCIHCKTIIHLAISIPHTELGMLRCCGNCNALAVTTDVWQQTQAQVTYQGWLPASLNRLPATKQHAIRDAILKHL